jgi:hypothetical protein
MPPKKKTSTTRKKATTTKKKVVAKKSTKKPKAKKAQTKKTTAKRKKVEKKPVEPISFGLLQHEIDELLENHYQEQSNKKIESTIAKELAQFLPDNEKVSTKKTTSNHTDILVKSTHRNHSPFVLDLSELIEKKRLAEAKKHLVRDFFIHKTAKQVEPEQRVETPVIREVPKMVVIEKQEVVKVVVAKKEKVESIEDQFTQQPWYYSFNLPINWHRSIIVYLMICLMIIAPIKVFSYYSELKETKEEVMNFAQTAYEDLKVANKAIADQDFGAADENFNAANSNFAQATEKIDAIGTEIKTLVNIIPTSGANLADAEYLLQIGEDVSTLGNDLVKITEAFQKNEDAKITDRLSFLQENIETTLPKLQKIKLNLNKIREQAIPEDKIEMFIKMKDYFSVILADLEELNRFSTTMNEILGKDRTQRYLFVFQNNNEIRPTGGFMGSMALADIDRGEITNLEIPGGGIYQMQGQLLENKIAPYPMQLINARWELQDSNWFPDFPTSAEKIRWFYEKSGGPTVDGVIAINVSLVPNLLDLLGPIALPEYGKVLNSSNFVNELQWAVEYEYDREENKPKQIISDMAPILLDKIFSAKGEDLLSVIKTFKTSLDEKDIQMYFRNEGVQTKIASYNWTGELKQTSRDYLSIVDTNIGGYKTDAYIDQNYDLSSEIKDSGEIVNTLKITRTHNGNKTDTFANKSNIDFVRIYTPKGSQLISATGFSNITSTNFNKPEKHWTEDEDLLRVQGSIWVEPNSKTQVNNEFDKTVFANWIQTDVGETSEIIITYKLPFKINFDKDSSLFELFSKKENSSFHSLYLQKQSGKQNTTYQVNIKLPKNKTINWAYPEQLDIDGEYINLSTALKQDALVSFVLE